MMKLFGVDRLPFGKPLAAVLFVGIAGAYGVWVEALDTSIEMLGRDPDRLYHALLV